MFNSCGMCKAWSQKKILSTVWTTVWNITNSDAAPSDLPLLIMLCRALSSKVVSQYSSLLSPMAVDCVKKVLDPAQPKQ